MRNQTGILLAKLLCMFLSISLIFSSCKKEGDEVPEEPEVIIPETTKVISEESWQENIIAVDSLDWTLRFEESIGQEYDLEAGDIIISAEGEGLLRKITSIEKDGDKLIIETTQAALAEAVEKGSFEFSEELQYPEKDLKIEYLREGVELSKVETREGEDVQFTLSVDVPVHEHVSITGELGINPAISGKSEIVKYELKYLEFNFDIEEQLDLVTEITLASLELEKEVPLAKITFPTITVMMGPVPVTLTPVFTVKVGVNIGVSSTVTSGVTQDLEILTSVVYENGDWSTSYELDKGFDNIPPALNNTAEAKAYIKPQLDVKIYGIISPNVSTPLYGLLEAELGASPWWSLYAGLSADVGVKVKVLVFTLADFNANIFDLQYLIAEASGSNTNPIPVFTVEPESGDVETVFEFDGSDSYDNEDPTEDLMVRWDFDGDGNWDTDWDHNKITEHQYSFPGNFAAKMEVKDTEGLVNSKTHAVNVAGEYGMPCPGTPTVTDADGNVYNTVLIGEQCWMKENLNVGVMINEEEDPEENGIIEKYCLDNDMENCDQYGGYYMWWEMMQYTDEEGVQGICPDGWHIPTDEEWKVLEGTVDSVYGVGDPEWDIKGYNGYNAGFNLKSKTGWEDDGNGSDAYGFTVLPAGVFYSSFLHEKREAYVWSSTRTWGNSAWYYHFIGNLGKVGHRISNIDTHGSFSVRCLKD
ncbi:MAG: hypothetical protein K9G58_11585 [Bacteroidales bacterium]|nr:hypothetical protein [Bacteroidales bacterium]MCF8388686.1 hypothetical protein [Bacteroidales bacterium]MCF8398805.1 hypothetical protein [Bacteroidales bacterium]